MSVNQAPSGCSAQELALAEELAGLEVGLWGPDFGREVDVRAALSAELSWLE